MKKILVLALIILSIQRSFSQSSFRPAYVVTTNGDTLTGAVKYEEEGKIFKVCYFKESSDSKVTTYHPNQVKVFRFLDDKLYASKEIMVKNDVPIEVFLEALVMGKVTLYKYRNRYFVEKDTLFQELKNEDQEITIKGATVLRKTNEYKNILFNLLSDCQGLGEIIKATDLKEKGLTSLIEAYNECSGVPFVTYKTNKPSFKASVGVGIALTRSSIKFATEADNGEYLDGKFDPDYSFSPGIRIELSSPRLSERITFSAEVYYIHAQYTSLDIKKRTLFTDRNEANIELKQLKIPLGIRYATSEKSFSPYFNAGASATLHLDSHSSWTRERESKDSNEAGIMEIKGIHTSQYQIGFWGGIGAKKKINSNIVAHMEIRYEWAEGITPKNTWVLWEIENIQLLFGISF